MRRESWKVTPESGPRPKSKPNECLYCHQKLGAEHEATCLLRERTVVVRMSIEYTVRVPEFWDSYLVEFERNDSSWCASNALSELEEIDKFKDCLCASASFEYVREATAEDEARDGVYLGSDAAEEDCAALRAEVAAYKECWERNNHD